MQDFKKKLYDYEATPPPEVWDGIEEELLANKRSPSGEYKKHRFLFYGVTAAASVAIILIGSLFFNKQTDSSGNTGLFPFSKTTPLPGEKINDSVRLNQQLLKSIINNPKEKREIIASHKVPAYKKYLTVSGPEGQPVKISPKVATLIISADNEYPPKPVWNKKISKWQKIMLSSTVSPTSASFVDMVRNVTRNDLIE